MAAETVGARLLLSGREAFVADADAASAAIDKITESALRADAALDKMAVSQDRVGESAVATDALAASTVGATEASTARAGASREEEAAVAGAAGATGRATKAVEEHKSALDKLSENSIVKGTALFGTGALIAGAYESVKTYTKFNQAVAQSAVDAGIHKKDLPGIQQNLIGLSRQYGLSLNDVANTWYRIASAASQTHASLKTMQSYAKDTAKLDVLFNVGKGQPTEQTARIMGAMLNASMPGAKTPQQIMALANAAVGHGDIRGADIIGALGKVTSAAKFTKVSAPDVLTWIDALTGLGMQGSQAGTLINHSLQQLTTGSSEQAQKAMAMVGIAPGQMSSVVRNQGLPAAIQYLMTQIKKGGNQALPYLPSFEQNAPGQASADAMMSAWMVGSPKTIADWKAHKLTNDESQQIAQEMLSKMFGAAKSASPILAIASDPGKLAALEKKITDAATPQQLAQSLSIAMNTPGRKLQIAETNLTDTGATIGKILTPAAVTGMNALKDVASYLAEHTPVLEGLMAAMAAFVGSAMLVYTAGKIKSVAMGLQKIFQVITGSNAASVASKATAGAGTLGPDEIFSSAVNTFAGAVARFDEGSFLGGGGGKGLPGGPGGTVPTVLKGAGEVGTIENDANLGADATVGAGWIASHLGKVKGFLGRIPLKNRALSLQQLLNDNPEMLAAMMSNILLPPPGHPDHLSPKQNRTDALSQLNYDHPGWQKWSASKLQAALRNPLFMDDLSGHAGQQQDAFNALFQKYAHSKGADPNFVSAYAKLGYGQLPGGGAHPHRHNPRAIPGGVLHESTDRPGAKEGFTKGAQAFALAAKAGTELSKAASMHKQVSADQKAANSDFKAAAKEAASGDTKAATKTFNAGVKAADAATKTAAAAQKHVDAASRLAASAEKISAAADKLANTKINATISAGAIAVANAAQAANTAARGG